MKNSLNFLSVFLILFIFSSCNKKQDWTCVCVFEGTTTVAAETIILDKTKTEATQECDEKSNIIIDPVGIECHLEKN